MNTEQLIDVTDILAQPREFAQRLARVERERAELIETVARLRAECDLTEVSFVEMRDKRDKTRLERDAALREMQAERDAAKGLIEYWKDRTMLYLKEADQRAAAARKVAQWARRASKDADERYNFCQCDFIKAVSELDAARAEVARMRMALAEADKSAQMMADQFYEVSEGAYLIDPVIFDAHRQAIRIALRQPAPAQGKE